MLLIVYTLRGLVYGIAGLLLVRPHRRRRPAGRPDDNLDSITAVVLGAPASSAAAATFLGTLLGALTSACFRKRSR